MLDIGIIIPELAKYGGAERFLIECVNRWQHEHKITIYSSQINQALFKEHSIRKRVGIGKISPYFDGPHSMFLNCLLLPKIWEQEIGPHDIYHTHLWPTHLIDLHPMVWFPHEPLRVMHDLRYEDSTDDLGATLTRNMHIYPKYSYDRVSDKFREAYLNSMGLFDRLGKPDRIVANSKFCARYLQDVYGTSVKDVVYPGVNVEDFIVLPKRSDVSETGAQETEFSAFADFSNQNVILTVGQLWPHKRTSTILEAVKLVEDVQLYIVGSGPEKDNLVTMAGRLGIRDRVFFLSGLTNREVQILYARCLAVVFIPIREPLGIVALEAMAAGKPLIGVHEGGFNEVIDETCSFLVPPEPKAVADRISVLRDNKQIAYYMGKAGRVKAANYTWDRTATELLSVIQDTYDQYSTSSKLVYDSHIDDPPTLIGVQYYLVYGSGYGARHWNDNKIQGAVTDQPLLGYYASSKGNTIESHFKKLEDMGVDFIILNLHVEAGGPNLYELASIDHVFRVASRVKTSLKFAVQVCPFGCRRQQFISAVEGLKKNYCGKSPYYLSMGGKPVMYVFWTGERDGDKRWARAVQDSTEGFVRIAVTLRLYNEKQEAQRTYEIFDGFTLFSPLELTSPNQWSAVWGKVYREYKAGSQALRIFTVSPGYDDSHLEDPARLKNTHRRVPRENGATYGTMLDFARSLDPKPHQILISTFNEFHENTHIEPSMKYGSLYADMTKEFIAASKELWKKEKA